MGPRLLRILLVVSALLLPACSGGAFGGGKLLALATTTQILDFLKNVGGDRVEAVGLVGGDVDVHAYEPTADDARKVARARVIFKNGVDLEGRWLDALLKNAPSGTPVVDTSRDVPLLKAAEGEASGDPHIWLDPTNARKMVENIREGLIAADAGGADTYRKNADAYLRQLDDLDKEIQQQIETIPAANRKLVTNHDAFGYYLKRFNLTFVGSVIPSLSTDAQPSAAEVTALIAAIKAQQVKAIFTEKSLNPKLEQQIADQAGVKVVSSLYGDSLGGPGSEGDTYLKMMRYNTRAIVNGLK
jgi:ABC-type Zn uptake system ZnuABC Zn-binding protein ZnuA